MKRRTSKSKFLSIALIGFFLWSQGPAIMNALMKEGTRLTPKSYPVISPAGAPDVLLSTGKQVVIFWASWCGPCKLEMGRFKNSVEDGSISAGSIYAVNPFESPEVVRDFLKKTPYPFNFLDAKALADELRVTVTPTEIFIDNGTVTRMSTGISIIGIIRAESFL